MINVSEKKSCYSNEEIEELIEKEIPEHIAIIMDGNRRWAKKNDLLIAKGHWEGAKTLLNMVEAAAELKIKILTVYAFSTENWLRSKLEVETLMQIFHTMLKMQRDRMIENGVKLSFIGDISKLSPSLQSELDNVVKSTAHCSKINLVIALNYGGRDEIRRATEAIVMDVSKGKIKIPITEELISSYLDTYSLKDPDLLIRTSGEKRLSNFLLWQTAYAEMYTTEILWPEFSPHELLKAVKAYQNRQRRKGG